MLRGLLGFGKNDRPQPPKGKIEVVCPTCGAVQYEPRLVVSTFCKKCGDHLRIDKKRVTGTGVRQYGNPETPAAQATTSPAADLSSEVADAKPSAPAPLPRATSGPKPTPAPAATPATSSWDRKSVLRSIIRAAPAKEEAADETPPAPAASTEPPVEATEGDDTGFGSMIQRAVAADKEEKPAEEEKPVEAEEPKRRLSHSPAPTAAPPPASASTLQKMKDQGFYRQQYFKEAQCFDCGHAFKVGRSARSANCPQCGAWISMEDVEINMNSTQSIKTRGDVIIRKRGHLSTASVQCKDFHCQGLLEANVTATGDAVFKASGTIIGEVRCHRLVIDKGADVTFVNPIYADQVEIHAKITGTVFSRGQVLITIYGAVNGDVTARSVSIEPGGELNGAMNIIRGDSLPFDPTKKV